MRFLVLGATGMAGHMISLCLLERGHEVTAFSRRPFPYCTHITGDVRNTAVLKELILEGGYDRIVNCTGLLNREAEEKKMLAVFVNSLIPHYLSETCAALSTRIIHLSTDCVFSGNRGGYRENDLRDGATFYDRSKALGELDNERDLTFRNSIVGPDMNPGGIGLFNWFMKQNGPLKGYKNALWNGVTTCELAKAIERAAQQGLSGVYHLVNARGINKYELLLLFRKYFKRDWVEIEEYGDFHVDKSLVNTRSDFRYEVPDYEEMIAEMAEWVCRHAALYPHYE